MKPTLYILTCCITLLLSMVAFAQVDSPSNTPAPGGRSFRYSSAAQDLGSNGDSRSIEKGGTLVLGELKGPGAITHIWCTVGSWDPFYSRSLVLRVYYDGADKPSVEAPLGDFFGVGNGAAVDFTSQMATVSSRGRARNCYWRMPFRKGAKVTITNDSAVYDTLDFYYYLDWEQCDPLPEDTEYFHATYRQEYPAQAGDYLILDTKGRGRYMGTVHSVMQMETGWYGEGDDRFYIDGEDYPSLSGTGTEDYFGDAWGFRKFDTPYHGVSVWEGYFPGDRVTAYRWHLPDPVRFTKSLKFTMEHRGNAYKLGGMPQQMASSDERSDWVSSVAFWYQYPVVTFDASLPPADKRIPPYRVLKSTDFTTRTVPEQGVVHDDGLLIYTPATDNAQVDLEFEVDKDGLYQVNGLFLYSIYGGVYQPFLDGQTVGLPLDFCTGDGDPVWTDFDLHPLTAGKHTLRFEGRGVSPQKRSMLPTTNGFGVYYLVLLRMEDMDGFQALLDRKLKEKQAK